MRLVRSDQSGPLEIRIATLLRRSASDRQPSGCPAKTFKMVTWKLTVATLTIDQPDNPTFPEQAGFTSRGSRASRQKSRRRVEIGAGP